MKPGASDRELVLVVDHDELVHWSAAEELKEYGYAVVVAPMPMELSSATRMPQWPSWTTTSAVRTGWVLPTPCTTFSPGAPSF